MSEQCGEHDQLKLSKRIFKSSNLYDECVYNFCFNWISTSSIRL